jgi:hypothetical protein
MLDVFNLPNNERAPNVDIQQFVGAGTNSGFSPNIVDVHEWKKPRGITMMHILCIGAGGGGGGGQSAAAGTSKAGGAGGGSGSLSTLLIPAIYLPDKLYVLPGNGGRGGAAGVNGTTGSTSLVLLYPDSLLQVDNILINSSNSGTATSGGGTAGSGGTAGTGGSGMLASTSSAARWSQLGLYNSFAGNGGSSLNNGGSPGSNGQNFTYPSGSAFIMPGTGGGGTTSGTPNTSGGIISFSSAVILGPVVEAKSAAAGPGSVSGSGGYVLRGPVMPFFVYGGLGGGGADAAAGGNGGDGVFGSGGGGGGAGTTGGTGGDGGAGIVIITCW